MKSFRNKTIERSIKHLPYKDRKTQLYCWTESLRLAYGCELLSVLFQKEKIVIEQTEGALFVQTYNCIRTQNKLHKEHSENIV